VKMLKEDDAWKFAFGASPETIARLDAMIAKQKHYTNAFKKFSEEIRVDSAVRNEAEKRFRDLLTEAVNAR
jgi:hypothetical protein